MTRPAPVLDLVTGPLVPDVERIAVLRAGGVGDFLFTVPALQALRAAYPDAEIVLLGAPWLPTFTDGRPGPWDRTVVVPPSQGVRQPAWWEREDAAELDAFFARMRAERFDLAVQLHGGGGFSNPFLSRLGARVTAGLQAPDAPPLDRCVPYVYYQPETVRYLEVAALVGAAPVALEPTVTVTDADRAAADAALAGLGEPVVALHPGAGDPRRRWPAASFAALGDRLAAAGASVVVVGAPDEIELVDAVTSAMRAPARGLAGEIDLGGLAGVLARCAVVVGNDSGPRHLAAAVGAATVGLWWCGNLVNAGPLTRARHRPHVAWGTTCPDCGAPRTESRFPGPDRRCACPGSWIAAIPVDDVARDACDVVARECGAVF